MRRAFTIVELLIAVAIVAILASLLAPSLRKALEAANYVNCANNQRQQLAAVIMWAGDHRGNLPNPGGQNAGHRIGFADVVTNGVGARQSCLLRNQYLSDWAVFLDRPGLSHPTYAGDWGGWKGPNEAFFYAVPIYVIDFSNAKPGFEAGPMGLYEAQSGIGAWSSDAEKQRLDENAVSRLRLNKRYNAGFAEIPYSVCRVGCTDAAANAGNVGNGRARLKFCEGGARLFEMATHGDNARNPLGFLDGHAAVVGFNAMDGECPAYEFKSPW